MTILSNFQRHFLVENLKKIFSDYIVYSGATGIDNLTQHSFRPYLDHHTGIISQKALVGKYKFSKYKLRLISKGRNKIPREISIPTVRDRIALRALCDFLTETFQDTIRFELPQNIIKQVKSDVLSNSYDGCIKLDVANFYPSIRHKELLSRVGRKVRHPEIKDLIRSAISSPTVIVSKKTDISMDRGVPQGLAISNILAAIYLSNIDRHLNSIPGIKYQRYVDDVLILCKWSEANDISKDIIRRFRRIGLVVHDPIKVPEKSSIEKLDKGFSYLGYRFYGQFVGVRQESVEKLKNSLVSIFTSYKYAKSQSEEFLLWRLNLRITGCVYENKSKGWLFFFSEINDESLLHTLDHYVNRLITRFEINVTPKKFVRAFKELSHNKYGTSYIPNFDKYDLDQQKSVLVNYFGLNLDRYLDAEIEYEFKKRLNRQTKDLQADILNFS